MIGVRVRRMGETDGRVGSDDLCGVLVVVTRRGVLALGQWRSGCVSMRSMRSMRRYRSAERGRARL